jgi:predicted transcriptional regulator
MDSVEKVLDVIKKASEPVNASKVVELSGSDKNEVDKAMKKLKDAGDIVSPKRCYWSAK